MHIIDFMNRKRKTFLVCILVILCLFALLKRYVFVFLLMMSAEKDSIHLAKVIVALDSDVINETDSRGLMPIHVATAYGNKDLLIKYIDWGANVNALTKKDCIIENTKAKIFGQQEGRLFIPKGTAPINIAAEINDCYVINILIKNGCNIENKVWGSTPLQQAVQENNKDAVRILLEKGADPENINNAGLSVLENAVSRKNLDIEEMLINKIREKHLIMGDWVIIPDVSRDFKIKELANMKRGIEIVHIPVNIESKRMKYTVMYAPDSAGQNRHEVANARVVQARPSQPAWPRVMYAWSQGQA